MLEPKVFGMYKGDIIIFCRTVPKSIVRGTLLCFKILCLLKIFGKPRGGIFGKPRGGGFTIFVRKFSLGEPKNFEWGTLYCFAKFSPLQEIGVRNIFTEEEWIDWKVEKRLAKKFIVIVWHFF